MHDEPLTLAILGCGTMGRAILGGLLNTGLLRPEQVRVTVRTPEDAFALQAELGVRAGIDNATAAREADIALLCVKPKDVFEVLGDPATREALAGTLLISIAAGVRLSQYAELVPDSRVIRAMPNTPSVIREGMTVISKGASATPADVERATAIFSAVGRCRTLDEKHLDTVTGLSGSGPAFVCVILEALADGGVMMGLPREVAVELAAQTVQGTARLVLQTGEHPAALKDQVTTPAGCTIAGLLMMEDRGIRSTLARTVEEAARVAGGLGVQKR